MSNQSGNLVKSYFLYKDDGPRVIDSNSYVEERLEQIRMEMPKVSYEPEYSDSDYAEGDEDGFQGGLDADTLDALMGDAEIEYDEEGNPVSNIIKAAPPEEPAEFVVPEELPYMGPTPEQLIADAQAEIDAMRVEARAELDRERTVAYEEGKASGYQDGMAQAAQESEQLRLSLENEKAMLEERYQQAMAELEPEFVHMICRIYEKVFEVDLAPDKNLVISLLHNAMTKIDSCKNYLIHVSREDYQYVAEHKQELYGMSMTDDTVIDIVEDITMKANDCMIETVNGIYDCSLGTQLEALRKKLELLSYIPD